jgi:hypothetical protein
VATSSSRRRGPAACLAAALLLLCACGEGTAPPPGEPPAPRLAAEFGALTDVIVVTAIDRQPLTGATLVDPDGMSTPAYSLDVSSSPVLAPSPAEQALREAPGPHPTVTRLDAMVATALIRVPDPARYGKTWRDWRVVLELGDPAKDGRDVTLPAPAPRSGS